MNQPIGMAQAVASMLAFWGLLTASGLPLARACLPRARRGLAPLVAPVAAIAGLSSLSHLSFFALSQPYRPLATYGVFIASSMAFWALAKPRAPVRGGATRRSTRSWIFAVVPVVYLLIFGTLFHAHGVMLFSAGEDEFGYIDVARQIVGHLNTRDSLDVPWPEPDHLLTGLVGSLLTYAPGARLGAFVLLADLSRLLGVGLELAFPMLVGVSLTIGLASLGLLRLHLRRSGGAIVAAQAGLACSFVLVMLHFQGSLSSVVSLGFRLGGLAVALWAVQMRRGWRPLMLAAVVVGGWLPVYLESFGIGLVMPMVVGSAVTAWLRRRSGWPRMISPTLRSLAIFAAVALVHPDLMAATVHQYAQQAGYLNMSAVLADLPASVARADAFLESVLPAIVGVQSLYDDSLVNQTIAATLAPFMPAALMLLGLLAGAGFVLRLRGRPAALAWAALPSTLALMTALAGLGGSLVAAIRGAQWLMPQGILGLSLLAFGRARRDRGRRVATPGLLPATAAIAWALLVGANGYSVVRTMEHVASHTQETELALRQFDPSRPPWTTLRADVATATAAPVLLSGFDNTPVPHMIGEGLGDIRVLLGHSITAFWVGMDPTRMDLSTVIRRDIVHWRPTEALLSLLREQPIAPARWPQTYANLLGQTTRAIVPVGGGYPVEWGPRPALLGTRSERFPNLCDVVDRTEPALDLLSGTAVPGHDADGLYWTAASPLTVRAADPKGGPATLSIALDGPPPTVAVNGAPLSGTAAPGPAPTHRWTWRVDLSPANGIVVDAPSETRLRAIDLYR